MITSGPSPAFRPYERWCAVGDSLTQGGLYHHFVQLYYATRFPENRLELFNCGVNGDTTARVLARLDTDVLNHKPTLVSILLGMNDISPVFSADASAAEIAERLVIAKADYRSGMRSLVKRFRVADARVLLITPGLYDETLVHAEAAPAQPGLQAALLDCAAIVHEVAFEFDVPVIDWTRSLMDWNAQYQKNDPAATLINLDRVHPGDLGSFVMAYEFLKGQAAPREVSRLVLNAVTGRPGNLMGCSISNIEKGAVKVSFDCLEKSLPFPIPETCRPTLVIHPFIERFNLETLQVEGLPPGTYQLLIDGILIQTYSAEQLQAGVNLALEPSTPQYKQAQAVADLVGRRSEILRTNLRTIVEMELGFLTDVDRSGKPLPELKAILDEQIAKFKVEHGMTEGWQEFMSSQSMRYIESKPLEDAYQAEISSLLDQTYRINKPSSHHLEIIQKSA